MDAYEDTDNVQQGDYRKAGAHDRSPLGKAGSRKCLPEAHAKCVMK